MYDFLNSENASFFAELFNLYKQNPSSVDEKWQRLFRDFDHNLDFSNSEDSSQASESIRALMLIRAYRVKGHLFAKLDPLGLENRGDNAELHPSFYGFKDADYSKKIFIENVLGLNNPTLQEIVDCLEKTYSTHVGVEFMHIQNAEQKSWIQEQVEGNQRSKIDHKKILEDLTNAEFFEKFLNTKFPGAKRFGLEGAESLIPALEHCLKIFAEVGVDEINMGAAHRGRLCILANILQKPMRKILAMFKGQNLNPENYEGSGDVKYHLGYSSDRIINNKKFHLSLNANPSHLEAVNPVVLGKTRAKQDLSNDVARKKIMSILLHGDAAFAGQGIVFESLSLCGLSGYETGGTLHIIINNQIGFTTSPPHSRSSPYSSDVAKSIQAPIFHVNGDHPEEVVWVAELAAKFVHKFGVDAVIDITCYRRFGHNESDEPSFTQPIMYKKIASHPSTRALYVDYLNSNNLISESEIINIQSNIQNFFNEELDASAKISEEEKSIDWMKGEWSKIQTQDDTSCTGISLDLLKDIGAKISYIPNSIDTHPKIKRFFVNRKLATESLENIDWSTAEALAFAALNLEGYKVRLSGQDSCRGTFSQRHAVIFDQTTEKKYIPINNVSADEKFEVLDSPLAEASVLGFEYGYSSASPNTLVLWEAQFGDFANGAQVIIDQFISSAEKKWSRLSGLVMLLPHGFEGQGPEHSSARIERYLQLCAEDNMQVVNCSTPANYFHVLRRQIMNKQRKPLIIFTPKSLLRHKLAVSKGSEMQTGTSFKPVIWWDKNVKKIRRVILCSGKVFYDLFDESVKQDIDDVVLLRLEQFYPFPETELINELNNNTNVPLVWCQEEPQNMGAWNFLDRKLERILRQINTKHTRPYYAGRKCSASPATGIPGKHELEQKLLISEAFYGNIGE